MRSRMSLLHWTHGRGLCRPHTARSTYNNAPMIDTTLEQLFNLGPQGVLPPLCNVVVRLARVPEEINEGGGRWELAIETPGNTQQAWIAVHRNPHQRDYGYR